MIEIIMLCVISWLVGIACEKIVNSHKKAAYIKQLEKIYGNKNTLYASNYAYGVKYAKEQAERML